MNDIKNYFSIRKILFSAVLICVSSFAFGQNPLLDSLNHKFDHYRVTSLQEKLYVQLDSKVYLTGETIWFKIHYVDGTLNRPIDLSKVAFLEILDTDNHAVAQTKVALKNGSGSGSLFLPASINAGNFTLRAYTNWMKNFNPEYYFHTDITILNTFRKFELDKSPEVQFSAQFFPEGGNLINGLKSKVAFQVQNSSGHGIDFSGMLLNQTNDTITRFKPLKFGIGNFAFTPLSGDTYRAIITDTLGHSKIFNLPKSLEEGYVLEVRDSSEDLLTIRVRSKFVRPPANPSVYFFIHARQIISQSEIHFITSDQVTFTVSKKDLQEGISHMTLFDHELRPQCERLYFKPSQKKLLIEANLGQREYGIRRKVVLDISVPLQPDSTITTSLSVAVVKKDSLQSDPVGNIFSYLWLSSDLGGTIESPEYYVENSSMEGQLATDNLMLTHGWRRFAWNDILSKPMHDYAFVPELRSHLIRGKVINQQGLPANGVLTYLSTPGKNIQLYGSRSNANGEVMYEMKDFRGAKKIVVQTNTSVDSTSRIQIESPFSSSFVKRTSPPFRILPNLEKTILTRSVAMQVQDVFHEDNSNRFTIANIDSTAFYGRVDETYYLDDYNRFTVMEEVLREYVPGVMVRMHKDGFHFLVLDNVRRTIFREDPLVLLDGTPVFDIDKIMAFDPLKVKKLEVVTRKYFLGPLTLSGIVSFTTYAGDLGGFQLDPKSVSLDYEGLQLQRVFYAPLYDTPKQRESRIPDRRHLLFWNPEVALNKEGKQHLEFYTSDLIGEYNIVIEGLTKNGASGSATSFFSVKQFNN